MAAMTWALLTKIYDRIEAEMVKSALGALDIPVELIQEGAGESIPLSFGKLAEIQVFVPKQKLPEAKSWLRRYGDGSSESDKHPKEDTVLLIPAYGMGNAKEELRLTLLEKYFTLILEADTLPNSICFYTEGVRCVAADSPLLPKLQEFERRGVRLIVCNTCLKSLGVTAETGIIGGMPDIIEAQMSAKKVITL